jgi:hypothetical protein
LTLKTNFLKKKYKIKIKKNEKKKQKTRKCSKTKASDGAMHVVQAVPR